MFIARSDNLTLFTALLFGSLILPFAHSEEPLQSEAEAYLRTHDDQAADARWIRTFHERAVQAMRDNPSVSNKQRYADDKVLEFFSDKKKSFEDSSTNPLSVEDKIEIARWYLLFFKNGWRFPSRIGEYLTKSNFEQYVAAATQISPELATSK